MRKRGPRSWPSLTADPKTRAGEALKRLEDITRLVSDLVWETDKDLRLIYVSDNAHEVFGFLPVQMEGKAFTELGRFHDGAGNEREIDPYRPFRDAAFRVVDPEGRERDLLVSGLPIFGTDTDEFTGFRGTARDVTDILRAERMRREQEERQRAFVADVAHELRTPLAVFRTKLDNLGEDATSAALRKDVDVMTRMVSQMLNFARYEVFQPEANESADLGRVCAAVAAQLAPIAVREERSIEVLVDGGPVIVRGSETALEQAVRNLVENAVRHTPKGTIVTVSVTEEPAIHVLDHGKGVSVERRRQIFQRFGRADRRGDGAGLGLAIVKRIVDAHSAEVNVADGPDGGADFCIRFVRDAASGPL